MPAPVVPVESTARTSATGTVTCGIVLAHPWHIMSIAVRSAAAGMIPFFMMDVLCDRIMANVVFIEHIVPYLVTHFEHKSGIIENSYSLEEVDI